jgi:hypothetical protein
VVTAISVVEGATGPSSGSGGQAGSPPEA